MYCGGVLDRKLVEQQFDKGMRAVIPQTWNGYRSPNRAKAGRLKIPKLAQKSMASNYEGAICGGRRSGEGEQSGARSLQGDGGENEERAALLGRRAGDVTYSQALYFRSLIEEGLSTRIL